MDRVLQRAKRIFERAIELEPQVRADYVRAQCADDTPLRERVERLLGEHDKQGDFLASRSRDQADDRPRSLPQVVGHYRWPKGDSHPNPTQERLWAPSTACLFAAVDAL